MPPNRRGHDGRRGYQRHGPYRELDIFGPTPPSGGAGFLVLDERAVVQHSAPTGCKPLLPDDEQSPQRSFFFVITLDTVPKKDLEQAVE